MSSKTSPTPSGPSKKKEPGSWMMPAMIAGIVVVLVAVVAALTAGGDAPASDEAPPPEYVGTPLSRFTGEAEAPAPAPQATGPRLLADGEVSIPVDGTPTMIVFLAHWCSHCQAEVPVIQQWLADGGLPDDVALRAVTTAIDPARPNYPPEAWLEREGWDVPTMIDDGSIADAYGLSAFPFWAFVDADGNVVQRATGELSAAQLAAAVEGLRP